MTYGKDRMMRITLWCRLLRQFLFTGVLLMLPVGVCLAIDDPDEIFTDKIYLKNGDRITGSIKELDRGKLRLKTNTMDTAYLDWDDVDTIESDTYLRIMVLDGSNVYGRMGRSAQQASVNVLGGGQALQLPTRDISAMKPLRVDQGFLAQIEGEISGGIDYKQASDILLVNVSSELRFREERHEIEAGLNWHETQRSEGNNASRADLSMDYTRLLEDRYFWQAMGGLERNQELGIDLRSLIGGTGGRFLVQTPRIQLQVNGGIAISAENRTDGKSQQSVEGVLRSSFDFFELSTPMTRLSADLSVFPGITESGRVRVNTNIKLRNEFVRDFFWDLTFYSSYDNQPAEGSDEADYGVITSLGASF